MTGPAMAARSATPARRSALIMPRTHEVTAFGRSCIKVNTDPHAGKPGRRVLALQCHDVNKPNMRTKNAVFRGTDQ